MNQNEGHRPERWRDLSNYRKSCAPGSFQWLFAIRMAGCLLLLLSISNQRVWGVLRAGETYDLMNPSGRRQAEWDEVQGVWFGRVTYITISRGVRRTGSTVEALLVIGPEGKFLTVESPNRRVFGKTTFEYYRLAPPHKVLNNVREYCRVEKVDADGNPLPDPETGMIVGLMRPRQNQWKEFARIDFSSEGREGVQLGAGTFIRPMERPFRAKPSGQSQLFSVIYGNDRPGTTTETRAAGIAELKKLFRIYRKQGFDFVDSKEAVLSGNDVENLSIKTGPVERSLFLIYCRGDAERLYVEATQGPGAKYIEVNGTFPMVFVVPHKWTSRPLTEEFRICNAAADEDLTRPAKFGGGSTVEVTVFKFSNSITRGHRDYDFDKLR